MHTNTYTPSPNKLRGYKLEQSTAVPPRAPTFQRSPDQSGLYSTSAQNEDFDWPELSNPNRHTLWQSERFTVRVKKLIMPSTRIPASANKPTRIPGLMSQSCLSIDDSAPIARNGGALK